MPTGDRRAPYDPKGYLSVLATVYGTNRLHCCLYVKSSLSFIPRYAGAVCRGQPLGRFLRSSPSSSSTVTRLPSTPHGDVMTNGHTLEVHHFTSDSTTATSLLPTVLHLSNSIFNANPDSKYASFDEWNRRLSVSGAVIVYVAPRSDHMRPVAFLFAHPRLQVPPLACGEENSLHIWLAGVLPERRKEGCLAQMVKSLYTRTSLPFTICTTPEMYPDMWRWLTARGWTVERELAGGKVMLSKSLRT